MESILKPWPWYVAGPLIGLFVPVMVLLGTKLGVSSNFKHACSVIFPTDKVEYLKYSLKEFHWSLWFFGGLFLGGLIGQFLLSDAPVQMLFDSAFTPSGMALLFAGGLAVGFGTRYGEGCTSGHSIAGISNLQKASIVATVCFFAGGLTMRLVNHLAGGVL